MKKKALIIGAITIAIVIIVILIPKGGVGYGGITKENFEKVRTGMDNFEVNDVLDPEDRWHDNDTFNKCVEEISETYTKGKYSYTNKYMGEKGGYAIIKFEADYSDGYYIKHPIVIEKTQYDLK